MSGGGRCHNHTFRVAIFHQATGILILLGTGDPKFLTRFPQRGCLLIENAHDVPPEFANHSEMPHAHATGSENSDSHATSSWMVVR
jgi:hypothetical protein